MYNQYDVLTIGESSYKNKSNLFEYGLLEEFINRKVNNEGFKIIFIRDEAHIGTKDNDDKQGSQNLLRLKEYFYKCLYLSATIEDEDVVLDSSNSVVMSIEEAQDANLIKKTIVLNDGGLKKQFDESENLLLKSACEKLKYLKENIYPKFSIKLNKQINPALLIQISSKNEKGGKETKRTDEDEQKEIEEIVTMCKKFSLTVAHATNEKDFFVDDGWLYLNKKIKREELQKHDSEIDVIIFKTKLAIG
jgi:type III restriction enzyme